MECSPGSPLLQPWQFSVQRAEHGLSWTHPRPPQPPQCSSIVQCPISPLSHPLHLPFLPSALLISSLAMSTHARCDMDAVCAPALFTHCKLSSAQPGHGMDVLCPKYIRLCRSSEVSFEPVLQLTVLHRIPSWRKGSVGFGHWGK